MNIFFFQEGLNYHRAYIIDKNLIDSLKALKKERSEKVLKVKTFWNPPFTPTSMFTVISLFWDELY